MIISKSLPKGEFISAPSSDCIRFNELNTLLMLYDINKRILVVLFLIVFIYFKVFISIEIIIVFVVVVVVVFLLFFFKCFTRIYIFIYNNVFFLLFLVNN